MCTEMVITQNRFGREYKKKIDKVKEEYEILNFDKHFIPAHFNGKNCMGMDTYKGDELRLILYCKPKKGD